VFRDLLKRIAQGFDLAGVDYMVFGGQAVLVYGEFRVTRDIDIALRVSATDAAPVLDVISRLGLKVLVSDVDDFLRQTFVLPAIDPASGIRLDFVFSLSGYEQKALDRATIIDFDGVDIRFVSVDDLIVQKLVAGRPRDLEDARSVVLKNRAFDRAYVEKCLQEFDQELDSQFLGTFQQIMAELRR
jgi:hypothetical protein